ncbi:MAG: HRDC domain-containing protein, partial [Thermoguttaceae bacterium]|nr:HRDC domain-containing protein [Thermoguttaceae bacterium]
NKKLEDLNSASWFVEESREFIETVKNALTDDDQWRKLLHGKKFTRDELAVIRELWRWRRERAVRTNAPEHRIFRDDAIIEIAKLRSADPARIASLRTVGFSDSSRVRDLSDVVASALALPAGEKPREHKTQNFPQYALASQALDMLLNQFAVSRRIAPKLLATVSDVREAIAARKGTFKGTPRLLRGWRAEMLGGYLDDWLAGRYTLKFSKNLESEPFQIIDAQPKK